MDMLLHTYWTIYREKVFLTLTNHGTYQTFRKIHVRLHAVFDYLVTADILELRNIADVAEMIITSAMERHESVVFKSG